MSDLDTFAKVNTKKRGPQCWTCSLPLEVRRELRRGRKKLYTYPVLEEWLKTKGFSVRASAIKNHFLTHE